MTWRGDCSELVEHHAAGRLCPADRPHDPPAGPARGRTDAAVSAMTIAPITLEGRPWLCRRHRRAGVASELICCRLATRVADGRERLAWFGVCLEQKPSRLRADIRATIEDPAHGLRVLASHAFTVERSWCWGHANSDTDFDDRSTRNLRVR